MAAEDEKMIRQKLADENRGTADLEKFYNNVTKYWGDNEHRNIHYSPAIMLSLKVLPRAGVRSCSIIV